LVERGIQLARRWGVVLVLKGSRTLVTDGDCVTRNTTGNPGMATGGSGDVLTGVITALVCQGLTPLDAARLGVYIHGLAGDLAARQLGEISMTARDLIDHLPSAFQQMR
jgi:NAD(P)H-hydrate epimerase